LLVLFLALGYAGIELVGGLWTGSLALLADSLHMISDVAALALSLLAVWMASRPASKRRTFGNSRAEILAALANGLGLAVVAVFISVHAIERFMAPRDVAGGGVMVVAAGGLIINLVSLWILEAGRNESLNVRGAWLHVASDTLASVGVILAGLGIWAFGWVWLDPTVSIIVSVLVLLSAWHLIREALDVLMETVPGHLDPEAIRASLLAVPGVSALHCLHVWTIGSGEISLSSHLVVDRTHEPERLLQDVRGQLTDRFQIEHTTIQIEFFEGDDDAGCGEICEPSRVLG
jgi:cobalt-zinc-cadmium efflux system protein